MTKISETYQKYSNERDKRAFKITKKYLKNQIDLYKNKSSESINEAQEYAIDQDLNYPRLTIKNNDEEKTINLELIRVRAANKIKNIDLQIQKIKDLGNDGDQIQFLALNIPELVELGAHNILMK